jgi:DNA-binding beta-propeller fold protein YncE
LFKAAERMNSLVIQLTVVILVSVDISQQFSRQARRLVVGTIQGHPPESANGVRGIATTNNDRLLVAYNDRLIQQYDIETYNKVSGDHAVINTSLRINYMVMRTRVDNNLLYVAGRDNIRVFDLSTDQQTDQWTVGCEPRGMSVNEDNNLIITCAGENDGDDKVLEYDGDGQLVRVIILPPDMKQPRKTIQLTDNQFVVSHGQHLFTLNRVCLVECSNSQTIQDSVQQYEAVITTCYGNESGERPGQLSEPYDMVVDRNGSIIVTDSGNSRIVVFNSALQFSRVVSVTTEWPDRLHLDESRDRLYVGEWAGRVLVLKLSECL